MRLYLISHGILEIDLISVASSLSTETIVVNKVLSLVKSLTYF